MSRLLIVMGQIFMVSGIVLGIVVGILVDGFHWIPTLSWWISGAILGIIFFALGMMLELLEENNEFLRELLHRTNVETPAPPMTRSRGNSKSSLSSLSGYKMSSHE